MKGPDSQEKFIIFTTLTERKFVKKKKKTRWELERIEEPEEEVVRRV